MSIQIIYLSKKELKNNEEKAKIFHCWRFKKTSGEY